MSEVIWQPGMTLDNVEKIVIVKALRYFEGRKVEAARCLGISLKTLYNKLDQYELRDEKDGQSEDVQAPQSGVRKQPVDGLASEHVMPLPIGNQVQELPPAKTGNDSDKRKR